jgi:hypothetical protein
VCACPSALRQLPGSMVGCLKAGEAFIGGRRQNDAAFSLFLVALAAVTRAWQPVAAATE